MCRIRTNQKITTLFNMIVAVLASMLVGTILSAIIPEKWFVMGCVSVTAVLTEHYLTVNPSFLLKYITLPVEEEKKNVKKKTNKKK